MASRHAILVDALYRCALFLVGESKSFDGDLVYSFCLKMLKECMQSPAVDRFPIVRQMHFLLIVKLKFFRLLQC